MCNFVYLISQVKCENPRTEAVGSTCSEKARCSCFRSPSIWIFFNTPPRPFAGHQNQSSNFQCIIRALFWVQPGKWLLITWIFQAVARGYFVPLAFSATPQSDRCWCGNDQEEITTDFLRVPANDGTQEQHQVYPGLPPSLSLGLRDLPWAEVCKEQLAK